MKFTPKFNKITEEERNSLLSNKLNYCSNCKEVKDITEFYKNKSNKFGLTNQCKNCIKDRVKSIEPEKLRQYRISHRNKNSKYYNKKSKEWKLNNKDKVREYKRNKYNSDNLYRLRHICGQMVRRAYSFIGTSKEETTLKFLGYRPKDLKEHLENQFLQGMDWDNYGKWHIDHIIPISTATNLEEGKELSKLENLQPLWAEDNIKKGNKLNF